MATSVNITSPLLYRCFCTCAGFILISSDYTINLIGLYPIMERTITQLGNLVSLDTLRKCFIVTSLVLALSLIP